MPVGLGVGANEHLLAGVEVLRRERDLRQRVAVDRHDVGDDVDRAVHAAPGCVARRSSPGTRRGSGRRRSPARPGGPCRCRSPRACRVNGLRKPNRSVSAETPAISRPRCWIFGHVASRRASAFGPGAGRSARTTRPDRRSRGGGARRGGGRSSVAAGDCRSPSSTTCSSTRATIATNHHEHRDDPERRAGASPVLPQSLGDAPPRRDGRRDPGRKQEARPARRAAARGRASRSLESEFASLVSAAPTRVERREVAVGRRRCRSRSRPPGPSSRRRRRTAPARAQ